MFDFIRPDMAGEILEQMLQGTLDDLARRDLFVALSESSRQSLRQRCLDDLSNGGRGIRNQVEAHLVNPLSRALFEVDAQAGQRFEVSAVEAGCVRLERAWNIRLSRLHFPVTALGPGERLGIWFQGCSLGCQGCISPDTWPSTGPLTDVSELLSALAPWIRKLGGHNHQRR